ncbi:Ectonucleotide pyrophosphatase/phosphodiesterase family member 5 [Holothuria leucospilota]|uniref:Ectonucleotide pyrophosphatase/phosphodiesterase family member 5 n=1 Tax=Holothuria leucospilota TaxID=206669 RepID=A0A9Q1BIC6_HOLLE|nr:Ectonucleotide pyrophosphatase/phosphodiesterase family member 5 [Holothuria leucospilota]
MFPVHIYFILLVIFVWTTASAGEHMKGPLLLVVGMDSFRWDFLDRAETPNFDYLVENGVRAEHLVNVFPTKRAPNWYTIVTGLYPESHGIVNNHVYDPKIDPDEPVLAIVNRIEDPALWGNAEPIWITNQRQGGVSGVLNFPAAMTVAYDGMVANFTTNKYLNDTKNEERVDMIVELFARGAVNFGMIYYSDVDRACHKYGPESPKVVGVVEEMDDIVGYLVKKLKESNLYDVMNIMFVADHGQRNVYPKQTVFLNEYVDPSLYFGFQDSPVYSIFPHNVSQTQYIVNNLMRANNLTVYTKDTIPEKYHYRNNDRIPPILLMADRGWNVAQSNSEEPYWKKTIGEHGYGNDDPKMWPFFVARGPAFKKGHTNAEAFDTVDLYSIMCHIMKLEPAPHNGSLENVKHVLADYKTPKQPSVLRGFLAVFIIVVVIQTCILLATCSKLHRYKVQVTKLKSSAVEEEGLLDSPEL